MLTLSRRSPRRRPAASGRRTPRFLTTLALAATATLAAVPAAAAQSTLEADGTIAASSLGSTVDASGSVSDSLGSLAPDPTDPTDPTDPPAPSTYPDYVALGDSYAALGDNTEPAGGPETCDRSLANYPHQLDETDARVGELTDMTCGGAEIPDLSGEQEEGVTPQYQALEAGTDLVTLSIGGNDIGFGTIVACITRQGPFEGLSPQATCESEIGETISGDIAETFEENGPIDGVYDQIADRSPDARVVTTQYMPLMPAEGESCAFIEQLHPADVQWSREMTEAINNAADAAAVRNGHVSVMPTDDVDRSACAPADRRWTSFLGVGDDTAPMHPTALGQQAMAGAITAAL